MSGLRVLLAMAIAAAGVVGLAPAATAQSDGVTSASSWTYVVNTETNSVDVSVETVFTNVKPNRSTSRGTTQYYFTGSVLIVPTGVRDLSITSSNGTELDWERIPEDSDQYYDVIDVAFARNIFYRQSTTVNMSYRIIDRGPRTDSFVRVNDAYAGFEILAIDLASTVNVRVEMPARFRVDDTFGSQMSERVEDGLRVLEAEEIDALDFWAYVSASDVDRAVDETLELDGLDVNLRAWPDDPTWLDFATEQLTDGFPVMADMLGPWPRESELDLIESYNPPNAGYGGWYDLDDERIEITDALDAQLLFHELSHGWFNHDLFEERWITEGLAEVFAAETVARMDDPDAPERIDPDRVSATDANAMPLNRWSHFSRDDDDMFGYPASFKVMDEIADEIGIDGLAAVIAAAEADQIAYVGDLDPESVDAEIDDWRRFLDLAEEVGGAEDLSEIFDTWVVINRNQLVDRSEARAAYADLVAAGDGWAAPTAVRLSMADWKFQTAAEQMERSSELLGERDALRDAAAEFDLTLPDRLETDYEALDEDEEVTLEEGAEALSAEFDDLAGAIDEIREARTKIDGTEGLLTSIGLYGTDLEAEFDDAVEAFDADDTAAAEIEANEVDTLVDEAAEIGRTRLLLAVAVVVGLLVLVAAFVWWRRRRRSRTAMATTDPGPGGPGSGPDDGDDPAGDDDGPDGGPGAAATPVQATFEGFDGPAELEQHVDHEVDDDELVTASIDARTTSD